MIITIAPSPTPYPAPPGNGIIDSWQCINRAPVATAVPAAPGTLGNPTNQIYIPGYDCAVTHYSIQSPAAQAPVTVNATVAPQASGTPAAAGYNSTETGFGSWDSDFIHTTVEALFVVAFAVLIIGLLIHWGKAALTGANPLD